MLTEDSADLVEVVVDGKRATVTLNNPTRHNAQELLMHQRLAEIGRGLPDDVRAVVIRGRGPSFSSGIDLTQLKHSSNGKESLVMRLSELDDAALRARLNEVASTYEAAIEWLRKPSLISVAAIHGHTLGLGMYLALACDLRVAADDVQIAFGATHHGMAPSAPSDTLVSLVGYSRALELFLTGRTIGAPEAERLRLVNMVVSKGNLDFAIDKLVAAVLAADPRAVTAAKSVLQASAEFSHKAHLRHARSWQTSLVQELVRSQ